MADVESKLLDKPDETRPFKGHGHGDFVKVGGRDVARGVFEPGWRWSQDVKPIAGTDQCEAAHFGYWQSGTMVVRMAGGDETTLGPGTIASIPPGHDAWVVGDEPCVVIDFGDIASYAKG